MSLSQRLQGIAQRRDIPVSQVRTELVKLIADDQGLSVDGLLDAFGINSVVPGICTECATIDDRCEGDARDNYCHHCEENAVVSFLVLMEVV